MAFVNYKNTNNASSLLISDITASATTILITDWDQNLFPSNFHFLLTLEHLDTNENVILREIVKVVWKNQNTFTVERSAWTCVQDDTATNRAQDNTAHAFYSWDRVSLYWTAEQVQDIQNNLELKWNQDAIANVYDSSLTYAVWDVVVYKGDRYQNTTAVATPEEFDPTKWTKVNVQYNMDQQDLRIDNLETQISWLSWIMKVDVFVLWGWGGWGWWITNYSGWGGWAWWVQIVKWLVLRNKSQSVVVWSGWSGWWQNADWTDGWVSKVAWIVALWGWWGWYPCSSIWGHNWWSWWGAWACSWQHAWIWMLGQGHDWWVSMNASCGRWWAWGWAGAEWPIKTEKRYTVWSGSRQCMSIWWHWICTNFWGCVMCIWWGWSWWGIWGYSWPMTWVDYWWGWFQSWVPNCFNWKANTWGGGRWGQNNQTWWNWGSWLVIVRYPADCSYWIKTATWGTITTCIIDWLSYKVHTFTSSWTFTITETA